MALEAIVQHPLRKHIEAIKLVFPDRRSQAHAAITVKTLLSPVIRSAEEELIEHEVISSIHDGISRMIANPHHGILHGINVYSASSQIRDQLIDDGYSEYKLVTPKEMSFRAFGHDIAEYLPNIRRGWRHEPMSNHEKIKRHPELAAKLVILLGEHFGLDHNTRHKLAIDLALHDMRYERLSIAQAKEIYKLLSPAGRILVMADILAGVQFSGLDEQSIKKDILAAIQRNDSYNEGYTYAYNWLWSEQGRNNFQNRQRGKYDKLEVLLIEFFDKILPIFLFVSSKEGNSLVEFRQKEFMEQFIDFQNQKREKFTNAENLSQLQQLWKSGEIVVGMMDLHQEGRIVDIKKTEDKDNLLNKLNSANWSELLEKPIIEVARSLPFIPVSQFSDASGFYSGWGIMLEENDGKMHWIDPSVLLFDSKEDMSVTFNRVKNNFVKNELSLT